MDLKPMYETGTIKFVAPTIQTKKLETKVITDPTGSIPNGIYKVIHGEKVRQVFTMALSGAIAIAASILITLYATIGDTSGIGFVLPTAVLLLSLYKLLTTFNERKYLLRSVIKYREDLKIGLTSTPPFISKMYVKLHVKQIRHNGITFTLMFYGGIATLLLGGLKDVNGGIFNFDKGIHSLFSNPEVMTGVFAISLLTVVLIHIVLSVQRKKRILEINAYFGETLMPESEIETIRASKNKAYRRMFIFSVMIILVIPILVRMIMKIFRRK